MVYDWVKKTAKLSLVLVLLIQRPKKEEGKKKKGYTLPHRKQMPSRELKFTPVIKHSLGYQNSCY